MSFTINVLLAGHMLGVCAEFLRVCGIMLFLTIAMLDDKLYEEEVKKNKGQLPGEKSDIAH